MTSVSFIPYSEFERIKLAHVEKFARLKLISDMCRVNALSAVKRAGSGHLGSSFSSTDIMVYLYFNELNVLEKGIDNPDRDIFFSSKGHDCPALYSVFVAAGVLPLKKLADFRRLGGLEGHPDREIPGVEANSGSLGMGISKAKGIALAKKRLNHRGRTFVLIGDGELQEGQIWEAIQTTVHQKVNDLTVIVDHNKIQTDQYVSEIIDLRDIKSKVNAFGWHVEEVDGHNFSELENCFANLKNTLKKPKLIIAHTVKGKGVSFMEGLEMGKRYKWHSGAPDITAYEKALDELLKRINNTLSDCDLARIKLDAIGGQCVEVTGQKAGESLVEAYGQALVELGGRRDDLIVLDADLAADCGLRPFEKTFPKRFIENGIAEQDMVSTAGGLALAGLLPIVNSFGAFLASRANEQIYSNATEGTKIIYVCHYSGLIPAGPGKSHQSLRDISLFGALPNCVVLEPCNPAETKRAIEWCVNEAETNCMMRLALTSSPKPIILPEDYKLEYGRGTVLHDGVDGVLFAYGPVKIYEALSAARQLELKEYSLKVVNMPWLNRTDSKWIDKTVGDCEKIFVLDNHSPYGGLGDCLLNEVTSSDRLRGIKLEKFAVEDYPACGTTKEVLRHHKLDCRSIVKRILAE
ncbi:MAG: 1-deoxy-D-xylulose-5-phosphate synthase N-terminal domain-containing protein [Methanobacteriota archaeon]